MKSLEKTEILRLNCPGYGQESSLSAGKALPLDGYKVVIVNPKSILHLFDDGPEILEKIELSQSQGLTSLSLPNDDLLRLLSDVVAARTEEIVKFLEKGGLLIYYLCRPFVLQGASLSLDNYIWLLSLAPDQPGEKNIRHMSSVAQGRDIQVCKQASESEFSKYFLQSGLEWSTIIRTEFLTEGYNTLALAGPNKCIAAELYAGDNGGKIIFLPAPYSPHLDQSLIECVQLWYQGTRSNKTDIKQDRATITNDENPIAPKVDIGTDELQKITLSELSSETGTDKAKSDISANGDSHVEKPHLEKALKSTTEMGKAFVDITRQLEQHAKEQGVSKEIGSAAENLVKALEKSATTHNDIVVEPQEQSTASQEAQPWCRLYSLPGLEALNREKDSLVAQIEKDQSRVNSIQECLTKVEDLKIHLLGGRADNLKDACMKSLRHLGWKVDQSAMQKQELWLAVNERPEAIVRIVESESQPERTHLAQLAESVIMFWERYEHEPKALLIACTWSGTAIHNRKDADFSESMIEFAKKKNIGLITTHQLLCAYRDIEVGKISAEEIRQKLLTTSGALADSTVVTA